jgi:hypothetical protein
MNENGTTIILLITGGKLNILMSNFIKNEKDKIAAA